MKQPQRNGIHIPPDITLALWQLRHTWRLLVMTGLGVAAAVVLVCTIPLYSHMALSAGLHAALTTTPDSSLITIRNPGVNISSISGTLSNTIIDTSTQTYNQKLRQGLGGYLPQPLHPEVILQTPPYTILEQTDPGDVSADNQLTLQGYAIPQIMPHVHLTQGRLPQAASDAVEIALPVDTANELHLTVGSVLEVPLLSGIDIATAGTGILSLRVVGIFQPVAETDPFWHQGDFQATLLGEPPAPTRNNYQALVSSSALINMVNSQLKAHPDDQAASALPWSLTWYYTLDTSQLDITHINSLVNNLTALEGSLPISSSPISVLKAYQARSTLVQVPTDTLLALIAGMILLFVCMISSQLAEQRNEAIALMRSRGASRWQILGTFSIQQAGTSLIVLAIGPPLAVPVAHLLAQLTLPASDQAILSQFTDTSLPVLLSQAVYAFITIFIALVASILATYRSTALDVLELRHQATRNTHQPFWQRFYLDVFAALLALSCYTLSLYEINTGALNEQAQIQFLSPLILVAATFTIVSCLLLFLRVIPFLLEWMIHVAARSRSVAPTLAVAQMARAPRQALSATLLLSLTTAFAIFTLLFIASQTQRAADIATYMVGADFSGTIEDTASLSEQAASYQRINGVTSASLGYTTIALARENMPVELKAVDTNTFAQTVIWNTQDSTQPLNELMKQLASRRTNAVAKQVVPVIVDDATWNMLQLSNAQPFILSNASGGTLSRIEISFVVVARIQHIPTFSHGLLDTSSTNDAEMLVDYQTYEQVYTMAVQQIDNTISQPLTPNYFWLRTKDDDYSLASVRSALNEKHILSGALFYDRRALLNNLYHDPLDLDLIGVLALGAAIPLLLAIIGCLLITWHTIRSRLAQFTVLRALGTAPRQIMSILSWEQGPLYTLLILLGIITGWLLSSMTLPALEISSITTNTLVTISGINVDNTFTSIPDLPSIRMIIPYQVGIALAIVVIICLVSLALMIRMIMRQAIGKMLRLSED